MKPAKNLKLTQTALAFTRTGSFSLERLLVLRFGHSTELSGPASILTALEKGVTSWIENTPAGLQAWEESNEDFNIADFCSIENFQLQASLEAHGIHSVETLYELCAEEEVSYDYVLAHPDLKPDALYRDDGQRFSRNAEGTYSNDASSMHTPYTYPYSPLMETGKFSRSRPKPQPSGPTLE